MLKLMILHIASILLTKYHIIIASARSSMELHQVRFRAGLIFDENGVLHRTFDPEQPQYVGSPSPAIDDAWDALIKGRSNLDVTLSMC
jgi:hypothetical protein